MIRCYGTLGASCCEEETLRRLLQEGMCGIRLNLSHGLLAKRLDWVEAFWRATAVEGISAELILDTQGPELRMGDVPQALLLTEGETVTLGKGTIPLPQTLLPMLREGAQLLLDDGKLLLQVEREGAEQVTAVVRRGGILQSRKSLAVEGAQTLLPAVCATDRENFRQARTCGATGIMQPFVRGSADLRELRQAMAEEGIPSLRIFAKLETAQGVQELPNMLDEAEEFVVARGDLGNAMPLWTLPAVQKQVTAQCRRHGRDCMVVTQLLDSMQHRAVPTRAEVSDVYHAVLDGASSLMLTAETAVGEYPVEAMRYLRRIADEAERNL